MLVELIILLALVLVVVLALKPTKVK